MINFNSMRTLLCWQDAIGSGRRKSDWFPCVRRDQREQFVRGISTHARAALYIFEFGWSGRRMQNRDRRIARDAAHHVNFRVGSARIPFLKFPQIAPAALIHNVKQIARAFAIFLAERRMREKRGRMPVRFFSAHRTRRQFAHQPRYRFIAAGTKSVRRLFRRVTNGSLDGIEKTHSPFPSPIFFLVRTVAPISPRASRTAISSPAETCSAERNTRPFASYAIAYPRSSN